jgi:type II secretory pathway component GspD/PulD (secretin)
MRNFRLLPGPRSRRGFGGVIAFGAVIAVAVAMRAQKSLAADPPADLPAGTQPADELVSMDFPADGVELSLLADIVTRRLHIPIVYDEQLKGKKVIIRVPSKVPESALLGILQSALRMKQMALVDAEQPGWKQIVAAPNLAAIAKPGKAADADSPVAQVFILTHADPAKLAELLRPFLSQPGGYIQAETGQKVLIVGDYPSNVRRVEQLIGQLDSEAPPVETSFIQLKQTEAPQLVASVTDKSGGGHRPAAAHERNRGSDCWAGQGARIANTRLPIEIGFAGARRSNPPQPA